MTMTPFLMSLLSIGIISLVAGVIAVGFLINAAMTGGQVNQRIERYSLLPETDLRRAPDRRQVRINRLRMRVNTALSAFTSDQLSLQLASANWPITETEYLLIRVGSALLSFLIGWLVGRTPLSGAGLALIAFLLVGFILQRSIVDRRLKFERQLVDVLVLITGAVRAGYSFLQSLDIVINEMDAPASEEFRRVRREVGLGLPMNQALTNLYERMQNDDLYLVVTAININSQVGGNLATMLEAVTGTIRERVHLFSEIRALTAMQRYSSYILTFMPFIFAGAMFLMSPDYMMRLFEPGIFLCIPIGAVIFVILGNIIVMRLAKIDV